MRAYFKFGILALSVLGFAFTTSQGKMRIFLVGDSTMSEKTVTAYPETGWGMVFSKFIDTSNTVVFNVAQNGRSTKSFIQEGRWAQVVDSLRAGDIVIIQFGHNDEVRTKVQSTTEREFQSNLKKYIQDVRAKKATPVLLTPAARRSFNDEGKLEDTHRIYSELVRSVAKRTKTSLIDLDLRSQSLLTAWGPEKSKWLFNHLKPGQNPNYPEGNEDNTHFSELGARKMAEVVYGELKIQNPGGINEHFFKPKPKK